MPFIRDTDDLFDDITGAWVGKVDARGREQILVQAGVLSVVGGVDRPASFPTAAAGTAGALTGTYYYTCTFYTATGETDIITATPTPVTVSAQRVNLTNIPISPNPAVVGRRIYRNSAANSSVTNFTRQQLVASIPDNTSTTFVDNIPDGSLGVSVPRISSLKDSILSNGVRVANFNSLTTAQGLGAIPNGTGYANTAYGGNAMTANTTGQRNTGIGVFALFLNDIGDEHTAVGVHALNSVAGDRNGSTAVGYAAGINWLGGANTHRVTLVGGYAGNAATTASGMTAVGYQAAQLATTAFNMTAVGESAGRGNVSGGGSTYLGYQAGFGSSTAAFVTAVGSQSLEAGGAGSSTALGALSGQGATGTNNLFLGAFAGQFETASNTLLLDTFGRANEATQRTNAMLYGTFASVPESQRLTANALFRPAQIPTANRPAWAAGLRGFVYFDTTTNKLVLAGASAWETVTSA